jgi:outer membrane cobalamin receptor
MKQTTTISAILKEGNSFVIRLLQHWTKLNTKSFYFVRRLRACGIFLSFLVTIPSFAQSKLKDTVKINEVEVKAVKPKDEDKSLEPMQQISRVALDRVGGNTADGAVKCFTGVIIKDYGGVGGIKTVMVRSFGANHTGVFVDGVPFSDVASGQVDLGKISTDNADNVSLTIGQSTTDCQSARFYASANVISIQSADPVFDSTKYHFKLAYKTGSFGMINPHFSLQNKISKHSFSDVSCNYVNANGVYPYTIKMGSTKDTTMKRNNSDIRSLNVNARYVSFFADSSKLSLNCYFYNSQRGLPGAVIFYNPYASQRLWNNDFFSNIQYQTNQQKRLQWMTTVKYSNNYLRYLDPQFLNSAGKLDNSYMQHEYYASQVVSYKLLDSLHFSLASDFFINTLDANLSEYARPTRYSWLTAFSSRYSYNRFEADGSLLESVIREQTQVGAAASARNVLRPSLLLGYKLCSMPCIKFRMLYKDVFRMPTFNDLYYSLVGNNNLKPENARQYNLGFTAYSHWRFIDYCSFKIDGFYNQVSDKIVAIPTQNLFVWSMTNIGKVDCKGLEWQALFQTKAIAKVRYSFLCNYSLQKAFDMTDPQSSTYKKQIPYVPFETFSANLAATIQKFTLSYTALFNGFRYALGENTFDTMLPGWWVSDISALYDFPIQKYTIRCKLEINNIFDKQYEVIRSFPMPGRSVFGTIALSF